MPDKSYPSLFTCLYDEPKSVLPLPRHAHYSVFRAVFRREDMNKYDLHDFAVIWDGDHDPRIIHAMERIYMLGLLTDVLFVSEHKGCLTIILDAKILKEKADRKRMLILDEVTKQADPWSVKIGTFFSPDLLSYQTDTADLLDGDRDKARLYLHYIDMVWNLGGKAYTPTDHPF